MVICGVNDNKLRERFLREIEISLTKVIQLGQAAEQTKIHTKQPQIDTINKLKSAITSAPILQFFNPNASTRLRTDASSEGLGAMIEQQIDAEWKPVAFASRSLNQSEKQYAQIEKEILSIVFGCERFHEYLYGYQFLIQNDHKPLSAILSKPINKCPPRIQRFYLRLQKYNFVFEHVSGKRLIVSDTLSRSCNKTDSISEIDDNDINAYVLSIINNLPISKKRLLEFQTESEKDQDLQNLKQYTLKGWPEKSNVEYPLKPYYSIRDEISYHEGLLLKQDRIITPLSLRKEMMSVIHQGHFGIEKCKQRARSSVYWPGINSEIDNLISNCSTCLTYRNKQRRETMILHDVPEQPWIKVATDLFTLNNRDYIIAIDYHSKFVEVTHLKNTSSRRVIKALKRIFVTHGMPKCLFSDNGPQYASKEFHKFSTEWDLEHNLNNIHNKYINKFK